MTACHVYRKTVDRANIIVYIPYAVMLIFIHSYHLGMATHIWVKYIIN